MRKQVFVPSGALTLVTMLMLMGAPAALQGQGQAPSREAARGGCPQGVPALGGRRDGVLGSRDRQETGGSDQEGL